MKQNQTHDLTVLSGEERNKVLCAWNDTHADYPRDSTIHELVSAQVSRSPHKVAVTFEGQSLTYAELERRSNQLACHLQTMGVGPETLVGLYVQRSLDMIIGLLGILKAGGAYVPVDPDFPAGRIQLILEDSRPAVLVTQENLITNLDIDDASFTAVCLDTQQQAIASQPVDPPRSGVGAKNLAYVMYTSGSTGRPKGVQIEHRAVVNLLTSMAREPGLDPDDHLLALTTLSFDISVLEVLLPLLVGARLTIIAKEAAVDALLLSQVIEEAGITVMQATPVTWRLLLAAGWPGKVGLKVLSGGEALAPDLAQALLTRCGSLWNYYGPTETTVWSTGCRIISATERVTIGRPIANTQVYILDKHLEPLPIGSDGDLYIGGDGVSRGYYNRPDLTAERFLPNPFQRECAENSPIIYKTGDRARYLADGRLIFLGREDYQVKIRGFRIELGDVEAAVARHPALAQNVTIAREDVPGDKRLVSYLIPERGQTAPSAAELREFLRQVLPEYMIPAHFVVLDKFPLTPNNKINRLVLPAPNQAGDQPGPAHRPPRNPLENELVQLFMDVLHTDVVSIDDSFFDLGGNSLLAAQLIAKVRSHYQVNIPVRAFFEEPSVVGLSRTIEFEREATAAEKEPSASQPRARIQDHDDDFELLSRSNLTRGQFLMWMGQQIDPEASLYNVVQVFTLHGTVDVAAFRAAFQALLDQNDVLRTVIREVNGVPQQQVLEGVAATLDLVDFSAETNPQAAYQRWLAARKLRTLPMAKQLYDSALVKLAADHFVWYLNQHHMVTDAVSTGLLFSRLGEAYRRALDGRLETLPAKPQFADFVRSERQLRETDAFQRAYAYWREKYDSPLPTTDFYGRVETGNPLETHRVICQPGSERSARLRAIARQGSFASPSEDMALFTIFATLLFATLHRIGGQHRLRLGTPFHGRTTVEAQEIAGLLIEMGIFQVEIEEGETFVSLGQKVLAEVMDGLPNIQPGVSGADINRAYNVVLNFIQARYSEFAGIAVESELVHANYIDAGHPLRLQVIDIDASGDFVLAFDMKTEVFGDEERAWFVDHFIRVMDAFLLDAGQGLGDFSLLSAEEHQSLVVDFNDTDAPYPDHTVVQGFEEQVAKTPAATAAVDGEAAISYAGLNAQANRLAYYLRQQGVGPETTVAVCMDRSIDVLVAIWGILKAGGAYIPVDPAYPADRINYMIADAGPVMVLTADDQTLPDLERHATVNIVNLAQLDLSACPDANPVPLAQPDNLVYMIYTSGSTGRPKGTMLTHRGLLNYVWWARRFYQSNEVLDFPLYSSLAFDLTVTSIFVPFLSGGRIVVYGESKDASGLEVLDVFREDVVDIVKLTPAHLALVRELNPANRRIRKLIVGGEDFKTELARSIHELFGGRVEIYNEYGPTEAVVGCMIHRYDPQLDTGVSVPIGTPVANARIYLLDEFDQPVPPGVVGEMVISSDGVARGYHNLPELTAERFGDDPIRPGAGIYRSGDIARWNGDGRMVFLGRRDHQVKVGGARIELGEIEAKLLAHHAIRDVVVSVVQLDRPQSAADVAHCVLCGLPSNYPGAAFDAEGVCKLCRDFDTFHNDVFRYFKTMDDLMVIVEQAKAERTGEYDCMMLYSGGKDSTYVLSQLVELGLKVLAFSLDNGYISEEAKENIRQVTSHLGVDLVFGTTPHMNAIFADSLKQYSNVCQGCYKVIYTLSMKLAREKGIKVIFTGLSRGQLFETRLDELFRNRIFDVAQMDVVVLEARKLYHRVDDAVHRLLDVAMFDDDRIFDEIRFVDYFRYTEVELDDIYAYLSTRVPWIRPRDTGRSTNCLINEAGIYIHTTERGYHNYALPYSWDVRLGHKTREEALTELDDDLRLPVVRQMLAEVGYTSNNQTVEQSEKRLAAYYMPADETVSAADLRAFLTETLPAHMIPAYFIRLETLPVTPNGKVNRQLLPDPIKEYLDVGADFVAPRSPLEMKLSAIWSATLGLTRIGIHDNFFDLGGASIPAVQVVARISDTFAVPFMVRSFFEHPTIAEQGDILEELLVAQMESMSDEEAAELLAEMGA
ncbi:MAG: amino acid adenylation domain-containing protein [Chloroflexota bacterium]